MIGLHCDTYKKFLFNVKQKQNVCALLIFFIANKKNHVGIDSI
jgi:hypothetical protein